MVNTDALAAKYPDAVKRVVVVKEDHKRLYELAKAHFTLNTPIPGVIITHPDGRVLDGSNVTDTLPSAHGQLKDDGALAKLGSLGNEGTGDGQ